MDFPQIEEEKKVWVVFANTDGTEGRGREYVKHVCATEATARRLGRKGYVQGMDCPVMELSAFRIRRSWFVPGEIVQPSADDARTQERINERRAAIEKARAAGMTDEDLKALGVSQ